MATDQSFVDYVIDQLSSETPIASRKMFGEYALYADGKVVALVCDNQLFMKATEEGRAFIGEELVEAPAYEGARLSFLIEERLEDREWLAALLRITVIALPEPRPKKPRKKKEK